MSYFEQLLAHTGIDLAPIIATPDDRLPIVEVEAVQAALPMPTSIEARPPIVSVPVASPLVASVPLPIERPHTLPEVDDDRAPQTREPLESSAPVAGHSAPAEIVITERVIEGTIDRPRDAEPATARTPVDGATQLGVAAANQPTSVERAPSAASATGTPFSAARRPTIIDVRRWVTATPAAEPPPPTFLATEPVLEPVPQSIARENEGRDRTGVTHDQLARSVEPIASQIDLSIGAVHVIVEVPQSAAEPVRPPRPLPNHTEPVAAWSRLARRYVRA